LLSPKVHPTKVRVLEARQMNLRIEAEYPPAKRRDLMKAISSFLSSCAGLG
jgi:hypothetical protein